MMMMKWNEGKKNSLLEYWRRITSDEQKKKIKEEREKVAKKNAPIYTGYRAKKAAFTNKFTFIHHIRTHEQT